MAEQLDRISGKAMESVGLKQERSAARGDAFGSWLVRDQAAEEVGEGEEEALIELLVLPPPTPTPTPLALPTAYALETLERHSWSVTTIFTFLS